ncbi:hypothetical protein H310_07729 [Aphanomyces invadans]|uniref:Paired domain-containing protein n=1 Tax=Aphanomyces invadans TaxID=157072 RepID=A0A024U180_9STRA|nr:hypothetical protein H310_07729 [Aphanomyces invadans]ETV99661.1 hypothetical protein H310_07729 [Aphanomyces invadans]|eukprot:XP_008871437.1 hypothetical protein H310_07729 [Aphanomyces invadans]
MGLSAQACIDFVNKARHRTLTREERLDILRLLAYFVGEGVSEVSQRVATALGRSHDVVKAIVRKYNTLGTVTVATPAANRTNKTHEVSALRAVQRFLQRLGYKRGKKKGCMSYHLSTKNALLCDEYVRRLQSHAVSTMPPPVVYMDESFIHHHCKCHNDSL